MGNLNYESYILSDDGDGTPLKWFNKIDGNIHVYFRNLDRSLIKYILKSDAIFGCVAWLTNHKILDALACIENVSIVVQKEDFLKPDLFPHGDWRTVLRNKYNQVQGGICRYNLPGIINGMSYASCCDFDSIRCVGNYNSEKKPSFPRMHNKFLVFTKKIATPSDSMPDIKYEPYAVWTGSFNFSVCATQSFENAVYIENKNISEAYFNEFCQILALSEPLDWDTEWMEPEWRIGS